MINKSCRESAKPQKPFKKYNKKNFCMLIQITLERKWTNLSDHPIKYFTFFLLSLLAFLSNKEKYYLGRVLWGEKRKLEIKQYFPGIWYNEHQK